MKLYTLLLCCFLTTSTLTAMAGQTQQGLFFAGDHNAEPHSNVVILDQDDIYDIDDIVDIRDILDHKPSKRCKFFLWKLCMLKKMPVKFIQWLLGGKQPLICGDGESEIMIDDNEDNEDLK